MLQYETLAQLETEAAGRACKISEIVLDDQSVAMNTDRALLYDRMLENLKVMRDAVQKGCASDKKSNSGLSGGDAKRIYEKLQNGKTVTGKLMSTAIVKAVAVAEVNACMGKIVAAPTAGSCGILPSVLLTLAEAHGIGDDALVMSLFTAGGIGLVIANCASIAGAQGGCQAECGSASAMAAAAAVEMLGGTPEMCMSAAAFALQNMLGLVCDPVGGLVEIPCIKRNVTGALNAMAAAEMALAGCPCLIPADEVVAAMKEIGDSMRPELRETALGGMAATGTARRLFQDFNRCEA